MGIDRILEKFNKVKKAINSIKGIQSKIQSINYTTATDALGESQRSAEDLIKTRRANLKKRIGAPSKIGMKYSKSTPSMASGGDVLCYPKYDSLGNYVFFKSRKRRKRNENVSHPVFNDRYCALYVPDTLISQASVTYQQDGIGGVARSLDKIMTSGDGFDGSIEQLNKIGTKFIEQAIDKMTGGLRNVKKGRAKNPLQEQMLNGIPFRSWDFTFDFWPKSKNEAAEVNKIIYFFRSSMLPDAYSEKLDASEIAKLNVSTEVMQTLGDVNASYLNYPNVFDISFKGPLGSKIDGFLPAVCANAQVDYTGGQKFSVLDDGQPVHIQLTLNFLEIVTMTLGNYESQVKAGNKNTDLGYTDTYVNKTSKNLKDVDDTDG